MNASQSTAVPASDAHAVAPVRKTIMVGTSVERAFQVFTEEMNTVAAAAQNTSARPMQKRWCWSRLSAVAGSSAASTEANAIGGTSGRGIHRGALC